MIPAASERALTPREPRTLPVTDEDLAEALDQITDLLIAGRTIDGWTIQAVLDCEMQEDGFVADLARVLDVWADNGKPSAFWLRAQAWQQKLVAKHLPRSVIAQRANDIAQEREET